MHGRDVPHPPLFEDLLEVSEGGGGGGGGS